MRESLKKVYYFTALVENKPGQVGKLLEFCSAHKVNLINLTAYPTVDNKAKIDFVPEYGENLKNAADDAGIDLKGPYKAILIQGEDRQGVLFEYHLRLAHAGVNVSAANGTSCGEGRFGYIIQVDPNDYDRAANALGLTDNYSSISIN